LTSVDVSRLPIRAAGEVKGLEVEKFLESPKLARTLGRSGALAVTAARLAWADAGLGPKDYPPERAGVILGSHWSHEGLSELAQAAQRSLGEGGEMDWRRFGESGYRRLPPLWLLPQLPNLPASVVAIELGLKGPNSTITTACTAGLQAVGEAYRLLQRGEADLLLCGGADSLVNPIDLATFALLGIASPEDGTPPRERCRPFDGRRNGLVLGEGAAVLVLEEVSRARARGGRLYAEVLGYGRSFHPPGDGLAVLPKGRGIDAAMVAALKEAGVGPPEIDALGAHGCATWEGDRQETLAVKRALGQEAYRVPLSAVKSMLGYARAASGALEAAAMVLAVVHGLLPPTINHAVRDALCDLDYVPNVARRKELRRVMVNSFGLGGQNSSLVIAAL
jgi:3-oxoacyl-[acyl-carrier-protein] synthase II